MPSPLIHAVVPMKGLAEGKSRLSGYINDAERHALSLALLEHVLTVARAAAVLDSIHVLGGDSLIQHVAAAAQAQWADDHGRDLNTALAAAARQAFAAGAGAALIMHGDLAFLTPADVRALVAHSSNCTRLVIAPAESDGGTNALLVPRGMLVGPHFGPDSFARHRAAFHTANLPVVEVVRPGLALDLDTPTDLDRYRASPLYDAAAIQRWRQHLPAPRP